MSAKIANTYRITISEDEILGCIEALGLLKHSGGLNKDANSFLIKLEVNALKIDRGVKTAAYVVTGLRKEPSASMVNLGVTPAEEYIANLSAQELDDLTWEHADYNADIKNPQSTFREWLGRYAANKVMQSAQNNREVIVSENNYDQAMLKSLGEDLLDPSKDIGAMMFGPRTKPTELTPFKQIDINDL